MGYEAEDPHEAALLAALRANTDDSATREVYADWLEQHGYATRAGFLREEGGEHFEDSLRATADPGDAAWRAAISRPPISRCGVRFGFECTKRWDALTRTADDQVRHCGACDKQVFFVTSIEEAELRGEDHQCIAIDAAIARGEALATWDRASRPERYIRMGMVAPRLPGEEAPVPAPPPPPPPAKPGLMKRVSGWFKR
jgi:uncharacterized protein (TIGR02996 family)